MTLESWNENIFESTADDMLALPNENYCLGTFRLPDKLSQVIQKIIMSVHFNQNCSSIDNIALYKQKPHDFSIISVLFLLNYTNNAFIFLTCFFNAKKSSAAHAYKS